MVGEDRAKKLKRKANDALYFVRAQKRYMKHAIVTVNTGALRRREPLPIRDSKDDPTDATWEFEMTFSPFEGETYVLKNRENYRMVSEQFGDSGVRWLGTVQSSEGEPLGEYLITDIDGKYDISSINLRETRSYGYGFRQLKEEPETVLVQMKSVQK